MNATSAIHSEHGSSPWKGRGRLKQMIDELERRRDSMFDFVIDSRNIGVDVHEGKIRLTRRSTSDANVREWIPNQGIPINEHAFSQVLGRMEPDVPIRFGRSLIEKRPEEAQMLFDDLIRKAGSVHLVRCLDNQVRAFLSDRYTPGLDNYSLAFAALDAAREFEGEIIECSLSDTHMRIKMTTRKIVDAIDERRVGEKSEWYAGGLGNQEHLSRVAARTGGDLPGGPGTIHPLVTISNSETGHGRMTVRLGVLRAICFNLATVEEVAANVHLGQRLDPGIFSRATIEKDAALLVDKTCDSIRTAFKPERFKTIVAKCQSANEVEVHQTKAVDLAIAEGLISQDKRDDLLAHFLGGDVDKTAYGFAQSVSRYAQDHDDPDYASDLEDWAGKIISQPSLVAV